MKSIYSVLVFLVLSGMFKNSQAQIALGCPTGQTTGLSDTVVVNTSVSYIIDVVNTGGQDLFGSFQIFIGVFDSLSNFNLVDSLNHQPFLQPFAIADTIQVLITHQIDQSKFVEGNNTVVIWPMPPSGITTDSTFANIFVIYFNDVAEQEISALSVYPNPVQDRLNLVANESIEQVRIFDLNGRLISTLEYPRTIQMHEFTPGIYLFEIKSASGKIKRIKIIKS